MTGLRESFVEFLASFYNLLWRPENVCWWIWLRSNLYDIKLVTSAIPYFLISFKIKLLFKILGSFLHFKVRFILIPPPCRRRPVYWTNMQCDGVFQHLFALVLHFAYLSARQKKPQRIFYARLPHGLSLVDWYFLKGWEKLTCIVSDC